MNQLSETLSRSAKDLGGFFIMFAIVFLAYAQLGFLIFGAQVKDFRFVPNTSNSFTLYFQVNSKSAFTPYSALFLVISISTNWKMHIAHSARLSSFRKWNPNGRLKLLRYVFFVFFVLLNMFLAIINDTYSEVKADLSTQESEFDLGAFLKKGNML